MPHQMLQGRHGDAVTDHIRSKSMAEPVGIRLRNLAAQAMMAE